jgi:hypothetical protein
MIFIINRLTLLGYVLGLMVYVYDHDTICYCMVKDDHDKLYYCMNKDECICLFYLLVD